MQPTEGLLHVSHPLRLDQHPRRHLGTAARAFNEAFAAHGLDWNWSREDYRRCSAPTAGPSGSTSTRRRAARSRRRRRARDQVGDLPGADRPTTVWRRGQESSTDRRGQGARASSSASSPPRRRRTSPHCSPRCEPHIGADHVRPHRRQSIGRQPEARRRVLSSTHSISSVRTPADAVAIEDNVGGVNAAAAAGVTCVAFPNENTASGDFSARRRDGRLPRCRPSSPSSS